MGIMDGPEHERQNVMTDHDSAVAPALISPDGDANLDLPATAAAAQD
jgi:hypothetical protein